MMATAKTNTADKKRMANLKNDRKTYASIPADSNTCSSVIRYNTGIQPNRLSGNSGSAEAALRCRRRAAYNSVHFGRSTYFVSNTTHLATGTRGHTQNEKKALNPKTKLITNCVTRSRCPLV